MAFDPVSIKVSSACLDEVNRLRSKYRPDLDKYTIPVECKTGKKRKLTGVSKKEDNKIMKAPRL